MIPKTFEEFTQQVEDGILYYPNDWRYGQKVFNYVDMKFGDVARLVQAINGVDCFYNDDAVEPFLIRAFERIYSDLTDCSDKDESELDIVDSNSPYIVCRYKSKHCHIQVMAEITKDNQKEYEIFVTHKKKR